MFCISEPAAVAAVRILSWLHWGNKEPGSTAWSLVAAGAWLVRDSSDVRVPLVCAPALTEFKGNKLLLSFPPPSKQQRSKQKVKNVNINTSMLQSLPGSFVECLFVVFSHCWCQPSAEQGGTGSKHGLNLLRLCWIGYKTNSNFDVI